MDIISKTLEFVRGEMAGYDGSHDHHHVVRVMNNAELIAKRENITDQDTLTMIKIAALVHDVGDRKYTNDENAGPASVSRFLKSIDYPEDRIRHIRHIMENLSFSKDTGEKSNDLPLDIVRDADRLDAIGAVGIGRTFCYGGSRNTPMYDPEIKPRVGLSKEEYVKSKSATTTINHFYEKLFTLKNLMRTATGRIIAEKRHKIMEEFVANFLAESNGDYVE